MASAAASALSRSMPPSGVQLGRGGEQQRAPAGNRSHQRHQPLSSVYCAASSSSVKQKHSTRRAENVRGSFWVDETCIDCDTCRWMAPSTFAHENGKSAVIEQPDSTEGRFMAAQALSACPTHSIHLDGAEPGELKQKLRQAQAAESFPLQVDGCPGVYHTGFHNHGSFAATPYLIVRKEGNVLVDVPRFSPQLAASIESKGGIAYIFLTHRDDVAGHVEWAARFPKAKRIIHVTEANTRQETDQVEVKLEGSGPWRLPDGADDHEILFTPGHTKGCISLFHKTTKTLFTGDSLAWSARRQRLSIMPDFNWYDVDLQLKSVKGLQDLPVTALLPGHGRRKHFASAEEWRELMGEMLEAEG